MDGKQFEFATLRPFASTTWHLGAPASSALQSQRQSDGSRHGVVASLSGSSGSNSSSGRKASKGSRPKSSGGDGKAWFNFSAKGSGFSIGAGGGAAAWFVGGGLAQACPLWPLRGGARPTRRSKGPTRVLIFMSDTGGGHRASAEALRAGFDQLYGSKFKVDVVDLWTAHTPWPFNELPKSYSFMVKYPFIWRANFTLTQPRIVHVPLATASAAIVGASVSEAYDLYDPDLVISVHPLMQHVPIRVLKQRIANGIQEKNTAFTTVVTDLTTCHNTWFYNQVDRCYVATEETKKQALSLGLEEEQIRLYGLPIRPAFGRRFPAKKRLRKSLGMLPDTPAVLLVGGGEGMGPVEKTVDALAATLGAACQVVVVCGRNAKLVEKLSTKQYPPGMAVHVKGFVTNMPDFMSACDVIITKAGPGTISEALICGLPMVLNAFVPCQEEGNIPYVTDNGVGVFETKPAKVAEIITDWLSGGEKELKVLAAKAKALGKPDALFDIVKDLAGLVKEAAACDVAEWRSRTEKPRLLAI